MRIIEGEWDYMHIADAVAVLAFISFIASASGISVISKGSDYIIWDITGESQIIVGGEVINVSGLQYSQYELSGGTIYAISDINGTVYQTETQDNLGSVLDKFGIYILMFALVIVSYLFPISAILPIFLGIWTLNDYLPAVGGGFIEYSVIGVAMALSLIGASLRTWVR